LPTITLTHPAKRKFLRNALQRFYRGNPWRFDGADSASTHNGFPKLLAERGGQANGS
jgi:hypothetical protein